jgi:hypothetical protein
MREATRSPAAQESERGRHWIHITRKWGRERERERERMEREACLASEAATRDKRAIRTTDQGRGGEACSSRKGERSHGAGDGCEWHTEIDRWRWRWRWRERVNENETPWDWHSEEGHAR